jgi:hypothetical protein
MKSYTLCYSFLLSTVIIAIILVVSDGDGLANQDGDTVGQQDTISIPRESKWTGHVNYILGYKGVKQQLAPTENQVEFGLVDFDIKRADWPVRLAAQFLLTYSSNIII